jgi:hypothetical protein
MHRRADSGDFAMRRPSVPIIAAVAALAALAAPVAAAEPARSVQQIIPYTLADAVADYEAFGDAFTDCGDFDILATFTGTVTVTDWGDKMLRHVVFTGAFYNAADLSTSAERIGNTATWRVFDGAGNWTEVHIHGISNQAVLDGGRHIPVDVGYTGFSLALEEELASAGPTGNVDELCEALR